VYEGICNGGEKKQVEKKKQRFSRILQSAYLPICAARER
jgi:hypothetical protein